MVGLFAATPAAESETGGREIYKYTDDRGGVEYSDRRDPSGRTLTVVKVPAPPIRDDEASAQLEGLTRKAEEHRQNRELLARDREAAGAEAAARKRNCDAATSALETLIPQQRPQTTDEQGNLVVLDYEAKQQRMNELRERIREFCR